MKKTLTLLQTILIILLFGNLPAAGQTGLIKLDGGLKYEISNLSDEYALRIPITLESGVKTVKLSKIDVFLGDKHDLNIFEAFQVVLNGTTDENNAVPAITVTVKTTNLEQGTYKLLMLVEQTDPPDASKKQNISLDLILPATKIQMLGALKFGQTNPFIGNLENSGNMTLSLLQTTARRTVLRDFTAVQATLNRADNEPTAAKVLFQPLANTTSPDLKEMTISLDGVFPLGTTTGTALINSPQLSEPISVPFEIKVRRPEYYILITIIIGLIASFFVRTIAQKQIDLYKAREKATEAIETLQKEWNNRQDEVFRNRINDEITNIEQKKAGKDIAALTNVVTAANTAFSDALTELGTRRLQTQVLIENMNQLLIAAQSLPKEFAEILSIKSRLDAAKIDIGTDNVGAADEKLKSLISELHGKVKSVLPVWRPKMETFLSSLKNLSPFLASASIEDNLNQNFTDLSSKIKAIAPAANPTIENLESLTDTLSDIHLRIKELLISVELNLAYTITFLKAQFESTTSKNKVEVNEFFNKLTEFQKMPADWLSSPSEKAEQVQQSVIEIETTWKKTMLALVAGADDDVITEVSNLLNARQYRQAAAKTIEFLRKPVESTPSSSGGAESAASSEFSFPGSTMALDNGTPVKINNFTVIKSESASAPSFEAFKAYSRWQYNLWRSLIILFASAGVIAIGYFLFVDKFVGTETDLLAIFVWAFGTDVSITSLISLGTNLGSRLKS